MGHERRILEAFSQNKIERILLIDDVYDVPSLTEIDGSLLDFMSDIDGLDACKAANLNDGDISDALAAVENNNVASDALLNVRKGLYAKFVDTRDDRFDPGNHFKTVKGLTLAILDPLIALLQKSGKNVEVRLSGLLDGEQQFKDFGPQIVFLDYYLSPEATGQGLTAAVKSKARLASVQLLDRLLKTKPADDPAIVLMSSEQVKDKAQAFRQDVEDLGENVLALRFRFLQKGWVSTDGAELKIENEAADTLLDTSQGYVFGQVLHRALKEWRSGAESALKEVLKQIGSLEPKDLAYLFRFRLASEGEKMGSYLEWLFGENLRALVAEKVDWSSEAFTRIDDKELSKGIEGAFDGPSVPIARFFHRVRVDEQVGDHANRRRLGDIFIQPSKKRVMVVITPDCDLVPRGTGPKVTRLLAMEGQLRSFDEDSASADQFIIYKKKPYSLKWDPKSLHTFPVSGSGSLGSINGMDFLGTLRPLYAQEVQHLALTDLGRIGLSVAPTMGVDASVTVHLRVKSGKGTTFEVLEIPGPSTATVLPERSGAASGHRVLLRRSYVHALVDKLRGVDKATLDPEDSGKLTEFLQEKNEERLIGGFLVKGSTVKEKGPLSTSIQIAAKPDVGKGSAWLQFTLKLSDEAMEDLLSLDPTLIAGDEARATR